MQRSRRDALRSVLLVAAVLAGLVAVRSSVTGGLRRPMAPPAPTPASRELGRPAAPTLTAPAGTRLVLGGRQPIVVDATSGTILRIPPDPEDRTVPFRQGDHTVLVANRRSATFPTSPPWTRPSGRSSPRSTWTSCAARPMGVFINDIAPERAAQLLRDAH
jgi:hypothetical protein